MSTLNLTQLAERFAACPAGIAQGLLDAAPAVQLIAVGGVRDGLNRSVSPDGSPFVPLRFPRPSGGDKPLQSTGLLGMSVSCVADGETITLRANARGARLHQLGGTVHAKRGKYLAIPMTRQADRKGSPRRFGQPLFFLPSKGGKPGGSLAAKGRDGKPTIHYLLRESVTVPARRFLGFSDETRTTIAETYAASVAKAVLRPLAGG